MTRSIGELVDLAWQAVEARASVNGGRRLKRPVSTALARAPGGALRLGVTLASAAELP